MLELDYIPRCAECSGTLEDHTSHPEGLRFIKPPVSGFVTFAKMDELAPPQMVEMDVQVCMIYKVNT